MLQGDEPKVETVIEKLVEKFSASKTSGSSSNKSEEKIVIPEDLLVGLAAMSNIYPEWFDEKENRLEKFTSKFREKEMRPDNLKGFSDADKKKHEEFLNKLCRKNKSRYKRI